MPIASLRRGLVSLSLRLLLVNQVEDGEDLLLGDAVDVRVEAVEAREDRVDELVSRFAVLQTARDAMGVHGADKLLEFVAYEQPVVVAVSSSERLVNLSHEKLQGLRVRL